MKRTKITSVILSIVMCMTMIMPSVSVIADEAPTPSETQEIDEPEKKISKETEKPATKETKKTEPKEGEKQAPEWTEKPKETEGEKPVETMNPSEIKTDEPIETEKQVPAETGKNDSGETEKQGPTETEKKEPAETSPSSTEQPAPTETDNSETETKIPEQVARRKASNIYYGTCGSNINWTLDNSGTLSLIGSGPMYDYSIGPLHGDEILPPWFDYENSIKKIVISEGITTIGDDSFSECNNVTSVTLPDGLKSIGMSAFGCPSLTSISIPQTVTSIGIGAFEYCESLTSINIPSGVTKIEAATFNSCSSLKSLTIPSGVISIGQAAFEECTSLKTITIPASVKTISDYVFDACTSLTDIYYKSTESDWKKISIDEEGNELLEHVKLHFEGSSYTLVLSNVTNGSATLSSYLAKAGDSITVTTTPNYGYTLDVIRVNGTVISGKQFTMPASDVIVEVVFKRMEYTVTLNPSANGAASLSKTSAISGELITVNVTPDTGYMLDVIKVNNTKISSNTFTMPTMNATVDVIFKKIDYTVTLSSVSNGIASLSKTTANYGDEITINTTPATGYVLDVIKVNGSAISGSKFFMPAKNTTVEVAFKKTTYTVTLNTTNNGTASLSKTSANYGDEIIVNTSPATGYVLDVIKVNGTAISGNKFTMPANNTTVDVTFRKATYTITLSSVTNGTASLTKTTASEGEEITVKATPVNGYTLDVIKVNGTAITGNTFTMPAQNVTVDVSFKKADYKVTLADIDSKTGTASLSRNEACAGDEVVITINPAQGYELDTISVNGTTISEMMFIMPDQNVTVLVTFKMSEYTFTVKGDSHIHFDDYKTKAVFGEYISISYTVDEGYYIKTWVCHNCAIYSGMNSNPIIVRVADHDSYISISTGEKSYAISVSENNNGSVLVLKDKAKKGEKIGFVVKANEGYEVDEVKVSGSVVYPENEGEYYFNMPSQDVVIEVTFAKKEHNITLVVSYGGTATLSKEKACIGEKITITPVPSEGYYFECAALNVTGWEFIDGNTFTMPGIDVVVWIEFSQIQETPVGESAIIGENEYKVTAAPVNGVGGVSFISTTSSDAKISVPNVVSIKGIDYKVLSIANNAFAKNPNITTLVIGNNVTVIGANAFLGCKKLVKVSGGARVKTIGTKAFASCPKLKTFVISSPYLAKIGTYAFSGDSSLKTIYIKNTTKLSKKGVKKSLKGSKVKTVKVKKSKVKKYKKYFKKSNSGRNVKVKK